MNAHEMEAVTPMRALELAAEKFPNHSIIVEAGDDLIEFFHDRKDVLPVGASFRFTLAWVPYRRDAKRAVIDPAVRIAGEWQQNPEWLNAPEEYVRFYARPYVILIPVTRRK